SQPASTTNKTKLVGVDLECIRLYLENRMELKKAIRYSGLHAVVALRDSRGDLEIGCRQKQCRHRQLLPLPPPPPRHPSKSQNHSTSPPISITVTVPMTIINP